MATERVASSVLGCVLSLAMSAFDVNGIVHAFRRHGTADGVLSLIITQKNNIDDIFKISLSN